MKEFRLVTEARRRASEKAELASERDDIRSIILGLLAQFNQDKPVAVCTYSEEICGYPMNEFSIDVSRSGKKKDGGFDISVGLTHGEFTRTLLITDGFAKVVDGECLLNRDNLPADIQDAQDANIDDLRGFRELAGAVRLSPGID